MLCALHQKSFFKGDASLLEGFNLYLRSCSAMRTFHELSASTWRSTQRRTTNVFRARSFAFCSTRGAPSDNGKAERVPRFGQERSFLLGAGEANGTTHAIAYQASAGGIQPLSHNDRVFLANEELARPFASGPVGTIGGILLIATTTFALTTSLPSPSSPSSSQNLRGSSQR